MGIKGQVAWNKGKTGIYTKEQLKRMSESQKKRMSNPEERKRLSEAHKGIIAGNKNPFWGTHRKGEENPNWKGGEKRMVCLVCKKRREILFQIRIAYFIHLYSEFVKESANIFHVDLFGY